MEKKNKKEISSKINKNENSQRNKKTAMRVSTNSIIVNSVLSLIKFLAGVLAGSSAMISDAVHSASDVFSTLIVIIGFNLASKEADDDHQYGHERMECVASIVLAAILFATGLGIGYKGINVIIADNYDQLEAPGVMALFAAVVSIAVKEWMYWYTRGAAKKIGSGALMADAWHHRSDALSSVGSFIGIFGARLGAPILDPLASVLICVFILKAAIDIFKDAVGKMVDKSCDKTTVDKMKKAALEVEGVEKLDEIKTRLFGDKIYVDIEICVDGNLTLYNAHEIAESVHNKIEKSFENVKHCMVHVNPS